jgi:ketosteroid isomerase-like protein
MKMHVLLSLAALAIGFAVPALAQEQNTVDPEVRQQIEAALLKFEEAFNNHDAAAMATLFTVDAVQVLNWGEGGTFSGQQANEKNYAVDFASRAPEFVEKLIQVHAIGDEISAISEWSHGPWKGYHARIYAITVNGSGIAKKGSAGTCLRAALSCKRFLCPSPACPLGQRQNAVEVETKCCSR